ncbi:B12-binding domain-containing radical SAM protein [Geothrix fermentans]|uniref:B12-binding domain-containing radical SAM protein n=1 Tax=Geothrix fermentans TaxID=44676 RepID=UPI000411A5E3|nr:B12-binding domain-containing radical SAM protein [Geothrix fermentans]
MSKVLFVVPPYSSWGVEVIGTWPPLQIAYLAGAVEGAGHEARIYDAMNTEGATFDDIRREVERHRPDVVVAYDYLPVTGAISTAVVPAALRALALAKAVDPAITTFIGGPFPTFRYQELLHDPSGAVDVVLRGEAEDTLPELLAALAGGALDRVRGIAFLRDGIVMATETRPHALDLDRYKPAWHLLDWSLYRYRIDPPGRMASILTSRGCMMGCSFCSHRAFWRGDWRARTPEDVIEEIRLLAGKYGVESITLIDPYPTSDRARWERLLDLVIAADLGVRLLMETRAEDIVRDEDLLPKYRKAGVVHLYIGAEAGTDELLAALNKGNDVNAIAKAIRLAREHGIVTEASFMIGHPTETPASIDKTIEVAIRMNPDIAVFPVLTPMPFTPLFDEMKDRIRVFDHAKYNLATPILEPYAMTLEEVSVALGRCYMAFYAQKIPQIKALPDGFKRRYLLSACKEMMAAYGKHFGHLGAKMPKMHPHGEIHPAFADS